MTVRHLTQCYRCRRVFGARGKERFCPDCARKFRAEGSALMNQPILILLGIVAVMILLLGVGPVPALLSILFLYGWYQFVRRPR